MTNDLLGALGGLGGLGGLFGGLAKSMAGDSPEGQVIAAQTELAELREKEAVLFAQLGREAFDANPDAFGQYRDRIRLLREDLARAEASVTEANAAKEAAERALAEPQPGMCACGFLNPGDAQFCQECGARLAARACPDCGAAVEGGARFCSECGKRLD